MSNNANDAKLTPEQQKIIDELSVQADSIPSYRKKQIWDRKYHPLPETKEEWDREIKLQDEQEKDRLTDLEAP